MICFCFIVFVVSTQFVVYLVNYYLICHSFSIELIEILIMYFPPVGPGM